MAAVDFARENALDLSIRGGVHSVPGFGTNDDGVVIDLSPMKGIRVDPLARTVRAEGGCTWGDFFHATYAFGAGDDGRHHLDDRDRRPDARRRHRPPVARVTGCRSTTCSRPTWSPPTARFLVASEKENPDLFWALRGGGGNFGVVTSFEYQLHPGQGRLRGPRLLRARPPPARSSSSTASTSRRRRSRWARSSRSRSRRRCRSSRRSATARRSALIVACWAGPLEEGEKALAADPQGGTGRGRARHADAVPGAQQRLRRAPARRPAALLEGGRSPPSSPTGRSPRTSSTGRRCRS